MSWRRIIPHLLWSYSQAVRVCCNSLSRNSLGMGKTLRRWSRAEFTDARTCSGLHSVMAAISSTVKPSMAFRMKASRSWRGALSSGLHQTDHLVGGGDIFGGGRAAVGNDVLGDQLLVRLVILQLRLVAGAHVGSA